MHETELFRPTLTKVVEVLNSVGVRFHLTGGFTAVAYGEPRMTQDIDLVIDSKAAFENREALLRELASAGFHLEEQTARAALLARRHASGDELVTVKRMADERNLLPLLEQILVETDPS